MPVAYSWHSELEKFWKIYVKVYAVDIIYAFISEHMVEWLEDFLSNQRPGFQFQHGQFFKKEFFDVFIPGRQF